ncbi:hypothetical protein V1478_017477 [Vespula squamosa]|uniref:Uncharacterized protein n=1 Tax=Vespula squamosa TaxID=30214 RepID=A0ABD1ZWZ4_VESSQ
MDIAYHEGQTVTGNRSTTTTILWPTRMTSHGDFSTANSLFRATEKAEFHSDLIQSNDLGITQN